MIERDAPVVLVVDDNVANRALAQATLEDEGFVVVLAVDGEAGVAAFAASSPDCVLLDVRMPGTDGFGACRQIRALPGGAEVPVIFLTALRDVDTFDRALLAGGDDFLTKPVRPTELIVRVQTALKLRKMQAELREHYDLLKRQRDDLLRVQLQKERLMAFVVHDLKNPVNSLDLHAQLLQRDAGLPPSARDSVKQIRDEARQLNRLLLNLLDVSKADEGKLIPKKSAVALAPLIDTVVHELGALAETRNVSLRSTLFAADVTADSDLLRRLLVNLVENAIRHAPTGSSVTISSESKPRTTELWVRDEGSGVSTELRQRIFEPFVQLETGSGSANTGGRGLGLTFCRLVTEAHGGTIWVEDARPGALFRVSLPNL